MTNALNREECLERARMHEQLARATDDATARMVHQAMAAEFRRRAESDPLGELRPVNRPVMELCPNTL
ncbi:hypothetical protein [Sphingobium bisphenolivorans]|uniref:hypothetical protein n=1 Tax=Sphingobium bisphenolivorans TaxID=1335760 RepID=UPI0003B3FECC|nr:hypothetical protein [Sphingobium bisphenolivorans]